MFVEFKEYTVSPDCDKKNPHVLRITPTAIFLNGKLQLNQKEIEQIINLCESKFETAKQLGMEENHPYRGGRQCRLVMRLGSDAVTLCASGTNENIRKFYNLLKQEINNILTG